MVQAQIMPNVSSSSKCSKICDLIGYICGSLIFVAFPSILIPPFSVPLVFVAWILQLPFYFDDAGDRVLKVVQKFCCYFSNNAVSYVHNIWSGIMGSNN